MSGSKPGSKPPLTQGDIDHSAVVMHGKQLALIEERLARIETMLIDLGAKVLSLIVRLEGAKT